MRPENAPPDREQRHVVCVCVHVHTTAPTKFTQPAAYCSVRRIHHHRSGIHNPRQNNRENQTSPARAGSCCCSGNICNRMPGGREIRARCKQFNVVRHLQGIWRGKNYSDTYLRDPCNRCTLDLCTLSSTQFKIYLITQSALEHARTPSMSLLLCITHVSHFHLPCCVFGTYSQPLSWGQHRLPESVSQDSRHTLHLSGTYSLLVNRTQTHRVARVCASRVVRGVLAALRVPIPPKHVSYGTS